MALIPKLTAMNEPAILCRLEEIEDGGSRGFTIGEGRAARELFIVRQGARVLVYENSCPHTGGPLDWQPDVFLDLERRFIQCATHGALFRIEDGHCVHGPCLGAFLTPVPAHTEDGLVYLGA
ncbi:MAG: Rieske (2Fe-2S) protein [Alphaproteobacteria bacterium]